jgi:hypothetical protein
MICCIVLRDATGSVCWINARVWLLCCKNLLASAMYVCSSGFDCIGTSWRTVEMCCTMARLSIHDVAVSSVFVHSDVLMCLDCMTIFFVVVVVSF